MIGRVDPNYRRRYPGAPPFADLPLHRKLFFGREADARNLVDTILADSLVVVYARSGSGKTSLINVAVKERLRSEGYAPVVVRIGKHDQNPIDAIFQGIAQSAEEQGFEHHTRTTASLWHYFKTVEFWRGDTLLKPVLVIDQFEELFTLHTSEERQVFARELAHLLRGPAPALSQPLPDDVGQVSETPPAVKVVLSMREDFLAMVDELVPDLPNILSTRFRLSAMDREQARQAIEGPAGVVDEALESPTFTYTEGTVKKMIDFLAEGGAPGVVDQDGINPFQIQIVCQHVEDLVLARTRGKAHTEVAPIAISYEDLGGATGLRETVSQFYERQLNNFNPYLRRRIQRLCEEGLANREGRRIAQEQSEIINRFGVDPRTLGRLVDLRLLQRERRLGGNHYELSHDTLLHPVLNARRRRAQRRRTWRLSSAVAVLAVSLLAMFWFLWRSNVRSEAADYAQRSYQNESDSESRLIHAVAAVARSLRVTDLDPAALMAISDAGQLPTVFKTPLEKATRAVLSPDGQIVAVAQANALELRYPVDESFHRALTPSFRDPISILTFSQQGDRIAAASGRDVRVWDIAGRELGSVTTDDAVTAIAFDPLLEGAGIVIATNSGGWSKVSQRDGKWLIDAPFSAGAGAKRPIINSLLISAKGDVLVGGSSGAVAYAWTRAGKFIRALAVDAGIREWTSSFDAKGELKWLAAIEGSRVILLDAQHNFASQELTLAEGGTMTPAAATFSDLQVDDRPVEVAFSPDGLYLAVGSLRGYTHVFESVANEKAKLEFKFRDRFGGDSTKPVRGLTWSPKDHRLLTIQEGASMLHAMNAINQESTPANQTGGARVDDLKDQLSKAPVSRPNFALDGGGVILADYMQDWIRILRPREQLVHTEVYNPRVIPLDKGWLFATETASGFVLRLWTNGTTPDIDRLKAVYDATWEGRGAIWSGAEVLRAASLDAKGLFVVASRRPSTRSSRYEAPEFGSRSSENAGFRLYRAGRSGGDISEVPVTKRTAEIADAVGLGEGRFLLMAVDGAILDLAPDGTVKEVARVAGAPNTAFDQQGRLTTWLEGGQPKRWDLDDSAATDGELYANWTQDAWIANKTKIAALQSFLSVPTDAFVGADHAGDIYLVEPAENGSELVDRLVTKARVGKVHQLVARSRSAVALIASETPGTLSVVNIRGRHEPQSPAGGSAVAIGDRGRLVAILNSDTKNPRIRLSGQDLEETGSIFDFGGRCHPSAIAASPTEDLLIVGCVEGLMAAVTASGAELPHPAPAFQPKAAECWFERPRETEPAADASIVALAFAPSGKFFVGAARHHVAVWKPDGSLLVKMQQPGFRAKNDLITSLAVSPNGTIAVGTANGTILLLAINGTALQERGMLQVRGTGSVTAIAFSPNGRQLIAGLDKGGIQAFARRWWFSAYTPAVNSPPTTNARIVNLAFAPDGERFASGAANGDVRLFSSTYEPVFVSAVRSSVVTSVATAVAFTTDGRNIITSSDTSLENAIAVPSQSWLAEGCDRLAWSHRLRDDKGRDALLTLVRDACRPFWVERQSASSIVDAAAAGQIDVVDSLLSRNADPADPNATDGYGRTALMRAVAKGHASVARLLVVKGADVLRRDAMGATALHHAAHADARSIVPMLIDAGTPLNHADQNGRTALMIAATRGHIAIVQILIRHSADVNLADELGWTAVMDAADHNHHEIASLLREQGADLTVRERVRLSFGKAAGQMGSMQVETALTRRSEKDKAPAVVIVPTPSLMFRLPMDSLASGDAQRGRAARLIAWRNGRLNEADATALARDLSEAVTSAGPKPDSRDLVLLGLSRGFGVDGKPDWQAAKKEFIRAKSKLADTLVSLIMLEGLGEPQQFTEAVNRLIDAAEDKEKEPEPLGAWLLAVMYRDRYISGSTEEREAKARQYLATATTGLGASFGPAWNSKAFIEINQPRRAEAELAASCAEKVRTPLANALKARDVVAASNLAEWAWFGRVPNAITMMELTVSEILHDSALPLAQKTIRLPHQSMFNLGLSHLFGLGTERDYEKALKWLSDAAAGGSSEANRELGRMYEVGRGVDVSLAKAITYYRRAAADSDVYARNRLLALGYVH